jgi:TetR/AcrR family transcriptional repressor of nem operon
MKVSSEVRASNHRRIVESAAREFRKNGINGVGLEAIMRSAGLTPGAFYGHFDSKEALVAAALEHACDETTETLETAAKNSADQPLLGMIDEYLSVRNRDDAGTSCAMASLGPDVRNRGDEVRRVFTKRLLEMTSVIATYIDSGSRAERRHKSMVTVAALVGTLVLARAVDEQELSDEMMTATRDALSDFLAL